MNLKLNEQNKFEIEILQTWANYLLISKYCQ